MFTRIAVPLDGSPLAEKALPFAVKLTGLLNSELLLIRVLEEKEGSLGPEYEQVGDLYLKQIRRKITDPALKSRLLPERVRLIAKYGKPEEIPEIASRLLSSMIVMSTHGRTGLARLAMGSVARSIVKHTTLPVVLVRPLTGDGVERPLEEELPDPSREGEALLVALDGSPEVEVALEPAIEMAKQIKATVHLLTVIPLEMPVRYGEFVPDYTYDSAVIEKEMARKKEKALEYLENVESRVEEHDVTCINRIREGDPVTGIEEYAHHIKPLLVIMATHARGRIGQVVLGSVAEEVMCQSHLPVMMVHTLEHARNVNLVRPFGA